MDEEYTDIPIACNPHALSSEEWAAHQQRSEQLFHHKVQAVNELVDGYEFHFRAEMLHLFAQFVDGERRCCPFFTFTITVPPASEIMTLQITGNLQAKALLAQELVHLPA